MRNFDERMNEIRKRAEALRKVRRQRRSVAACCAAGAACLCLVLWNPAPEQPKQALPGGAEAAGAGETVHYSQNSCSVTEVRVSGVGEEATVQDPEKILHILTIAQLDASTGKLTENTLASGTVSAETCDVPGGVRGENEGGKAQSEASPEDNTSGIFADSQGAIYTVRLIFGSGEEKRYLLSEAGLEDPETGVTVPLDQNQRRLLLGLLGIN